MFYIFSYTFMKERPHGLALLREHPDIQSMNFFLRTILALLDIGPLTQLNLYPQNGC